MALTLKSLRVTLIDDGSEGYDKCSVQYIVGSTDRAALGESTEKEYTLTGQDLTDATATFDALVSKVKTDEGIT